MPWTGCSRAVAEYARRLLPALLLALVALPAAAEQAVVRLGGEAFRVEVARTPEARMRGLMDRAALAPDAGMLFVFQPPKRTAFWMKGVRIPLDILFIDEGLRVTRLYQDVPPCPREPCESYPSGGAVRYVLEVPGGTSERLGVRRGARVAVELTGGP